MLRKFDDVTVKTICNSSTWNFIDHPLCEVWNGGLRGGGEGGGKGLGTSLSWQDDGNNSSKLCISILFASQ